MPRSTNHTGPLEIGRREFLQASTIAALGISALQAQTPRQILIQSSGEDTFRRRLAQRELLRGLKQLRLPAELRLAGPSETPAAGRLLMTLREEPARFADSEAYAITADAERVSLTAGNEQALLYAVFDFLERQGAFFGIDGEAYPIDAARALVLPAGGEAWTGSPRFGVRGLLPWPDFLNCISVYNEEDFRAYFEAMLRMRFNTFGMHVYTGAEQWTESYLSFEFGGVGHLGFLDNSASHRWGYLPQRTSRYIAGGDQFFDTEVFGSDATRLGRDPWEIAERTRKLLQGAFSYAQRLGIRTGIGFEPYQIPDEIWRALPPEIKPEDRPGRRHRGARFDVESNTARDLLETRLAQLLEAYPGVDYVWLWEDEQMNWESRQGAIELSVTPFVQAHDFLRRHAPKKRLVLAGWGGVARHFVSFHRRLPGDIIFTALSDSLGWDPVDEAFGKLEDRERWPIPWIEDDPGMYLPQFHVERFEKDLDRAEQFGCQGMLGIHWRHRITDPVAAYQARASWQRRLPSGGYWQTYARSQAGGDRAARLASVLDEADKERKLLSTFSGQFKDGHAVTHAYSGDYNEAFTFWTDSVPERETIDSQRSVGAELRTLADLARDPLESERLGYLAGYVETLVPYAESFRLAHEIHQVLQDALRLRKEGQADAAAAKVRNEALPRWLTLAPKVRDTMLRYQRVVANRTDQGQLASMNNKFVRLALVRLRLSMKEFLGELPAETESLFEKVTASDSGAAMRLIVPTRPTVLAVGETTRLLIVVPGPRPVRGVKLHTRAWGDAKWDVRDAKLAGRKTYAATLGPFDAKPKLLEYFVSADVEQREPSRLVAPASAPTWTYHLTLS